MKKSFILILALTLSLLLSACGGQNQGQGEVNEIDYKQGTNGIQLEFLENLPPKTLFEESSSTIAVRVTNAGAYDARSTEISILGFDQIKIETLETKKSTASLLAGKSTENPAGDQEIINFPIQVKQITDGAEEYEANYFVKASYLYTNELVDTVCINPAPYNTFDSGCDTPDQKTYHGQGSPLVVSKIEQVTNTGQESELRFTITLSDKGKGQAKSVTFRQASLGGKALTCVFKDTNTLTSIPEEGEEVILRCTKILDTTSSYETSLFIQYDYRYEVFEEASFRILS